MLIAHDIPDNGLAAVKAATLIESLPWLKRYSGAVVVVKFGGNAMVDEELKRAFAEDMAYLRYAGVHPVIVHGGGPQISAALAEQGIPSEFRGGYRFTSTEAIDVVREVLSGQVNREIVELINDHTRGDHTRTDRTGTDHTGSVRGELAVGVSGEKSSLFRGERKRVIVDGEALDLGHVGDITAVDPTSVLDIIDRGLIPVVSSIALGTDTDTDTGAGAGAGTEAHALNVNADSAAAALAIAVRAAKLVVLTDVAGLYSDWPDRASLVERIEVDELAELLPELESGMIPKMTACLDAVVGGVGAATIIDGRIPHAILLEIFTRRGVGTEVVSRSERHTQ